MEPTNITTEFAGRQMKIETGRIALQATGSCTVAYGKTVVLATACGNRDVKEGIDFFPLTVDYEEKFYASGKIKGSRFIKREGRPSENAILNSRLIDRGIRPLFPKGFVNDVQIVTSVMSFDEDADPAVTAINAASTALMLSGLPFEGPIAAVRVGLIDNNLVLNPSVESLENSALDLVVVGSKESIIMIEAGANEVSEDNMMQAIEFGHRELQPILDMQIDLASKVEVKPFEYELRVPGDEVTQFGDDTFRVIKLSEKITEYVTDVMLDDVIFTPNKATYDEKRRDLMKNVIEKYKEYEDFPESSLVAVVDGMIKKRVRKHILDDGKRCDGRGVDDVRPISVEVGLLPMTHGSAMFKRGETQGVSVVTLGAKSAGQILDEMYGEFTRYYMHHYNFPPYSVGEARPIRSTGRREIGHGHLAERALLPMIPDIEDFPYTIRVVSEIVGSSGSTSQAAVCGSTLSLMDAGVPIKKPVSGIAMGLMTDLETGKYKILTDIKDIEDFGGDMDFKVAGTKDGITAIQMDIKLKGIKMEILKDGLAKAKIGRLHILEEMLKVIAAPREEMSDTAPRVTSMKIHPDQIREVIGQGGKVIQGIIADTGVEMDIEDDGTVLIFSNNKDANDQAIQMVKDITYTFKVGDEFEGEVVKIITDKNTGTEIGAIVQRNRGKEGMVHISELENYRVNKVSDICKVGDTMKVKVIAVDPERNRVSLSRKALLK